MKPSTYSPAGLSFVALSVLLLILLPASGVLGQAPTTAPQPPPLTAGQVNRMLDRAMPAASFQETPLTAVLDKLGGAAADLAAAPNLRWIVLSSRTLGHLPYGEATTVAARLPAMKLAEQLTQLLDPLGLRGRVVEDAGGNATLAVEPGPDLIRVGRRATIDELALLHVLHTTQIRPAQEPVQAQVAQALGRPVHFEFDLAGLDTPTAIRRFRDGLARMDPAPPAELLNRFCAQGPWTWRVEDNVVKLVEKTQQIVHQLRRPVSIRWADEPLDDALVQLGRDAGVLVQFQPGLMEGLEQANKRITWQAADQSTVQIIETIAGRTGLAYEVRQESVYFYSGRAAGPFADPAIGMVTIPSKTGLYEFRFVIRRSMLPAEAQAVYQQRVQQAINEIVKELGEPGGWKRPRLIESPPP